MEDFKLCNNDFPSSYELSLYKQARRTFDQLLLTHTGVHHYQ